MVAMVQMITNHLAEGNPKRTSLRIHLARHGASALVAEAWEPTVQHIGPLTLTPSVGLVLFGAVYWCWWMIARGEARMRS